jgi:hypothetical protein
VPNLQTPWLVLIFADTTWNWTKQPSKEIKFQELSNDTQIKTFS